MFLFTLNAFVFYIGACLGSFAGVCIDRMPHGLSVIHPRSFCNACKKNIPWYALLPIIGWLLAFGKCTKCQQKITVWYGVIEICFGLLAMGGLKFFIPASHLVFLSQTFHVSVWDPWIQYGRFLWIIYTGIILTIIDFRHRILPNAITLRSLPICFVFGFLCADVGAIPSILGWLMGTGFFWLIATVYSVWRKQEGLGMGDVKYLGFLGAALGPWALVPIILIASVCGSVVGIAYGIYTKQGLKAAIPFGPFLALGGVMALFWTDVFHL